MALSRAVLEQGIKTMIREAEARYPNEEDREAKSDRFAHDLSEAIHRYLSRLQITIPPGAIVVQGSPATQTNLAPIILTLTSGLDID